MDNQDKPIYTRDLNARIKRRSIGRTGMEILNARQQLMETRNILKGRLSHIAGTLDESNEKIRHQFEAASPALAQALAQSRNFKQRYGGALTQ